MTHPRPRLMLATVAAAALLAGCSAGTTPAPAPEPDSRPTSSEPDARAANLPAIVEATGERALTGCTNSLGWLSYDDTGVTELGVVAGTDPGTVLAWHPADPKGRNTRTEYRLLLAADGSTAAVTSVETVRTGPATPDRKQAVVQIFDLATRTQTAQVTVPGTVLPYGECYDDKIVLTPRRAYPVAANRHRATIVDVSAGKTTRSIPLRPDDINEDHVTAVLDGYLVINRYNRRRDAFDTDGVSMKTGKTTWHRTGATTFALPVLAYDPRFRRFVAATARRTVVVDAKQGKTVASVPAPIRNAALTKAAAIDPFTGHAYLTDGSGLARVSLVNGRAQVLPWAKKLQRVEFDLLGALDGHVIATSKGEVHAIHGRTGADAGVMVETVTAGGLNWAGRTDDTGALTAAIVYDGPMNPRVRIYADNLLAP